MCYVTMTELIEGRGKTLKTVKLTIECANRDVLLFKRKSVLCQPAHPELRFMRRLRATHWLDTDEF